MKTILSVSIAAALVLAAVITALQLNDTAVAQDAGEVKEYFPDIQTKTVTYKDGDTECEGFMAWDANQEGTRPVVLIMHDWMGRGAFDEQRARELASLGILAFSVDTYGKDVRPQNAAEAGKAAGSWKSNPAALRTRLKAGMDEALKSDMADKDQVACIGYCFGGTCVLELARSGANLKGFVSFHGGLGTDTPADAKNIKGKVLVLHGADDNFESVVALNKELKDAGVDYEIDLYGHTVHAFTNPKAGNDPSRGVAYNAEADVRSWERMKDFFWEIFE
ncbi:MAG: dienelactone hydrolase family protein [Planctomycetes bacterium]|nr:dienelactone hydrolase family protein [Planctomycetota bacterium]